MCIGIGVCMNKGIGVGGIGGYVYMGIPVRYP